MTDKEILDAMRSMLTQERAHTQKMLDDQEHRIRVLIETDVTKKIDLVLEGHEELDKRICELRDLNDKVDDIQATVEVLKHLSVKK